jgi:hypothetical protein
MPGTGSGDGFHLSPTIFDIARNSGDHFAPLGDSGDSNSGDSNSGDAIPVTAIPVTVDAIRSH